MFKPIFYFQGVSVPTIVPEEFQSSKTETFNQGISGNVNKHPLTGSSRRYVRGDRFHSKSNPHKSPLCSFHNIDLCQQASTIKTSIQESLNNKKNKKRNRSSYTQNIKTHIYYNYLMNYYKNEEIVRKQKRYLEITSFKQVNRDQFMRFILI